ncbi:flagellar hook-length control protein FliK [Pluralibacter sp.]|uniref:flagellar hook-length control protein FliK n=1 Tax=Pluralibacter sp. TaxID=1920032 RepID=UPI0025F8244F|nr:flagellar hook-length control protein FliK [Pluralibacter sp.]
MQPTPPLPHGNQASPASGKMISPASGSFSAMPQGTQGASFSLEDSTGSPSAQTLEEAVEQLRQTSGKHTDWQAQLDEVLAALHDHEQGSKESAEKLLETVSQMWQRQPQEPAVMAQMQAFLSALQKALATQPNSESLIAQIRGMQQMRPTPLQQAASLTVGSLQNSAPQQIGKLANGAPLAPLQAQARLTQPHVDAQLLSQISTAALSGEQLGELTFQAHLRQAQPQLPAAAGTVTRALPGASGYEFSPLTLDRQPSLWAEQMLAPLAERLRVQSHLGVKQATLRLDPPNLGKLDLQVRTEDDRVFIQISATNPAVRDQLLQLSDRLRQDLLFGQSYSQVDIDIGQHGEPAGGQPDNGDEQRLASAAENHEEPASDLRTASSDYHLDTYV